MKRDGTFYVLNACADIGRAIEALEKGKIEYYESSRARAFETLTHCIPISAWSAYDEGLLLIRESDLAREDGRLDEYKTALDAFAVELMSSVYSRS